MNQDEYIRALNSLRERERRQLIEGDWRRNWLKGLGVFVFVLGLAVLLGSLVAWRLTR